MNTTEDVFGDVLKWCEDQASAPVMERVCRLLEGAESTTGIDVLRLLWIDATGDDHPIPTQSLDNVVRYYRGIIYMTTSDKERSEKP